MLPHWPGDSLGVRGDSLGGGYLLVVLFCVIDRYQTKNICQTRTKKLSYLQECSQRAENIYRFLGGFKKQIEMRGK